MALHPASFKIHFYNSTDTTLKKIFTLLNIAGHRQKLEEQTKSFPDRFGDLERLRHSMRVTPTNPNPRGTLGTPGHFGTQAQSQIQGKMSAAAAYLFVSYLDTSPRAG